MANPDILTSIREDPNTPTPDKTYGDAYVPGELLSLPPEEAGQKIKEMWVGQDKLKSRYLATVRVNELRREGYPQAEVVKAQNRDEWTYSFTSNAVAHSNQAARICRKMTSSMFADPPVIEVAPDSGEPDDRDAADFANRILADLMSESGLSSVKKARDSFDRSHSSARCFEYFYVLEQGDYQPVEIEAHPLAVAAEAPFTGPDQPMMDGMGMPMMDAMGAPMRQPGMELNPEEGQSRFVTPEGGLSDLKADAAWRWVPKIKSEIVPGTQVRFLPSTASDIWDADGVLLASFVPLRELRKTFQKELAAVSDEELQALTRLIPQKSRDLAPGNSPEDRKAALNQKGEDRLVFVLRCYLTKCPEYAKGFYGVVLGDGKLVHRGTWCAQIEGVDVPLDLPLTETLALMEGKDEPTALMSIIGPGNELRASVYNAWLDWLADYQSRKTFVPLGSSITQEEYNDPDQRLLFVNPGGKVEQEQVEPFPESGVELLQQIEADMNHDSTLEETAQGVDTPNAQSGRAKFAIISQAQVGMTEFRQNVERAWVRGARIIQQQAQAWYTVPQKLKYSTPDGSFKERRWTGADLRSAKDLRLKPGTLSMQSPQAKMEQAIQLGPYVTPEQFQKYLATSLQTLTGIAEDPQRLRVRRQLYQWEEGPPAAWAPVPQIPQVMGVDQLGQPQLGIPPDPANPFQPVPSDELPLVAAVRLSEISETMASVVYEAKPPEWQNLLVMEFQRMRQMAGVLTMPEQQAAQAQMQMQQMAAKNPDQTAKDKALAEGQARPPAAA